MSQKPLSYFERRMAIQDCREALRNTPRTYDESLQVKQKAAEACRKLGIEFPEDIERLKQD